MHELSIAQAVVRTVCDTLAANGRSRASRIRLEVGKFTAVVPDALSSAFEWVSRGTACEGAALEIEEIPVRLKCEDCQSEFTLEELNLLCPNCQSRRVRITSGRELLIKSVEAE